MKAAVVTFVRAYNYGAILQCCALCKKLEQLGICTEVLDYYPQYFRDTYNLSYLGKVRLFPYRPIKNWLEFTPVELLRRRRNKGFEQFISRNIPLSKKQYLSFKEINDEKFGYDAYISGSDQVWSNVCVPFDPTFFLSFNAAKEKRRYSYAASFGFEVLPERLKDEYRQRLMGWDAYSVREESGVRILEGLVGEKAIRCCDPTLLLTKQEWEKFCKKSNEKKPYILIYSVNDTDTLVKYASELAESKELKVIFLTSGMRHDLWRCYAAKKHRFPKEFKQFSSASPDEWLGLFADAQYVLTDSFHGVVFSTIFQKKFMALTSFFNRKNFRAQELLAMLQIENRELPGSVLDIDKTIDWKRAEENKDKLKAQSLEYLKRMMIQEE